MRIKPEKPFDKWNRAYLLAHVNSGPAKNRKFVHLYNSQSDRKCISYARYLICVKLGRILGPEETVDHINNDPTDDRLENLQVLSLSDNIRKYAKRHSTGHNKRTCKCLDCVQHRRRIRNESAARRKKDPEALERIRESHRKYNLKMKMKRSRSAMDSTAAP